MNIKNVWRATWFSLVAGFILVTITSTVILLLTDEINSNNDIYILLFVLMVMGAVYAIVQFSFSFLLKAFLIDRHLSPNEVLGIALKLMLFLYGFVFFICWGISGFSAKKDELLFISVFSIPYVINCLIFVVRLHYLCWKDTKYSAVI
ncbi:MAG: hypothetical protein JNL95_11885 [Chitinophagales bacterium]|nr:hypothetical protein [Chitinophagales bacterium]